MMNSPFEDIEAAALQLAQPDRAHLAERRGDAFDRGEMGTIDFDESLARLKAKLSTAA